MTKDKYIDNSGDRKYFAMIPYYIVNHSTAYEQSLYLQMKRIASEKGTCWKSPNEIAKSMGVSPNTVRKYRDKLIKRGWIKKVGTRGKTKPTDEFEIVDLWGLNIKHYSEKESSTSEQSKRKFNHCTKKVQPVNLESSTVGNKEETIKKKPKEDITLTKVKVIDKSPQYGNSLINNILSYLKEKAGWIDGSQKQQRYGCNILIKRITKLIKEMTNQETNNQQILDSCKRLIDLAAADKFHSVNMGRLKYLYDNIGTIIKASQKKSKQIIGL